MSLGQHIRAGLVATLNHEPKVTDLDGPHRPEKFVLPPGGDLIGSEQNRLTLRFDKTMISSSQVVSALMNQIEVNDFTLAEPNLALVIRHIYNGELTEQAEGMRQLACFNVKSESMAPSPPWQ